MILIFKGARFTYTAQTNQRKNIHGIMNFSEWKLFILMSPVAMTKEIY